MVGNRELRVSLRTVVGWLEVPNDDRVVYLDRRNGEFITLTRADAGVLEFAEEYDQSDDHDDDADDVRPHDPADDLWLGRAARKAGHLLPLPTRFDLDEQDILEQFCRRLTDAGVRGELLLAIRGPNAFDRFRPLAWQWGLLDAWQAFRDRAVQDFAAAWLDANGIAHGDEPQSDGRAT